MPPSTSSSQSGESVSKAVSSFDLKRLGLCGWGWFLATGLLLLVFGIVCMMDPWVSVVAVGVTVGLVFILEGIGTIAVACISRRKPIL